MSSRTLQLAFSVASVCISLAVMIIVLGSTVQPEDGFSMDFSRGRALVLALSIVLMAASVYLVIRCFRVSAPAASGDASPQSEDVQAAEAEVSSDAAVDDEDDAIIRSLDEDELRLYDMIREAGGEILQMHLVSTKVFSKAKVTRLLDKLEMRGLVVRERHGMTNRIRIVK